MAPKIFVNYRHKQEGGWAAKAIASKLQTEFGAERIFLDVDGIPPGGELEEIRSEIARAAALVVVLGEEWHKIQDDYGAQRIKQDDDWVRFEIRTAIERQIPIFPLLLDAAKLPPRQGIPEDIEPLIGRKAWTVRQPYADNDLVPVIDELAKQTSVPRLRAGSQQSSRIATAKRAAALEPGVPSRAPIVVAVEEAGAPLTNQELLPAERHLTVTLLDRHVRLLSAIPDRLRQAASAEAIIDLGVEVWDCLCEASGKLAGLVDRVSEAEQEEKAPQPIAWTGRAPLLAAINEAVLIACPEGGQPLPFLSLRCGSHYFHPLAADDSLPRKMQRRESSVRIATVEPGNDEHESMRAVADALANEVLLIYADGVEGTLRQLADLVPRQPSSTTRAVVGFGASAIDAALIQSALAVFPCVSFAGPGAAQKDAVAASFRTLPLILRNQAVPVAISRLRRLAVERLVNQEPACDVAALRDALTWSTWSWVGRPLFSDGFGEVRKAAYPHLMDLRDVASSDWYYERSEGIPPPYRTDALAARDPKSRFHLYVSGAGGTGKSCFLRFAHDKLEVNRPNVLPVWYKVHAPSSEWEEIDAQIKAEVRAALERRLKSADHGLISRTDNEKDLWNFLLDLLAKLRARRHGVDQIALFIDQLERTFESGDSPELLRLTAISGKIGALLKELGTESGIRVFIASRKQYLADFLRSSQDAADINLHFVVLGTLSVKIEGAGFVERIVGWCNRNGLTPRKLSIDDDARQLLALSEDGHPLNMMLALIQLLSQADLPEEIDRGTLEQHRPWQQRFHVDEALMGKDELDWYFFLAMAHARTEIVRREEVLWRLGLVSRDLARRIKELGPNGVLERLWLLGHLGRTIHPRRHGDDPARFLEFFHANLRDHLVTNVMNRAEERLGEDQPGAAGQRRRGMPPAWRALDRLREIARDWQQLQQPLLREDISVLMDHKDVFCEPCSVPHLAGSRNVESFYLLFMRDVGDRRDDLFQAAKECVAYSAVVHDVLGRWAFSTLFPIVATRPDLDAEELTQVGCCRRWLRPSRADSQSRLRVLHYLVELRDAHANRLLADLLFDQTADDEPWQQLASILADPLVASTHRSAFVAASIQRLLDKGISLGGDNWHTDRLGAFLVATCSGESHELSRLLETLIEEVALLRDDRLVAAVRDLGKAARVERWLGAPGASLGPMLASREIHDVVPPVLELRVGEALAARIDPATVARWSQEIGARLGVPLPPVALPLRHAEVSRHRRTEEADAMPRDSGHELELLIRGRLVALGRFFPDRVQTLTRDWDGTEAQQAFPCFNEAQSEPVRWVEPSSLDGIGWRHPRWTFEQATVDWLHHLVRRHVAHVFGPDDLFAYLNLVAQQAGPARLPLSDLQSLANVLRGVGTVITRLVRERVPLAERNVDLMVRLIELARESDSLDVALAMPRLREHVRDDLCRGFADEANRLFLLLLDPADEQWLESNLQITKTGMRRNFKLAPEEALRLAAAVRDRFEEVARADHAAPVIVCRDYLRSPLFDVLQSFDPRIFVLSRTELSTDVRLTPRGLVRRFTAAPGAA